VFLYNNDEKSSPDSECKFYKQCLEEGKVKKEYTREIREK